MGGLDEAARRKGSEAVILVGDLFYDRDLAPRVLAGGKVFVVDALNLQRTVDRFHRGVVPTISLATHALAHAVAPRSLAELTAAILRSLVGVEQYSLRFATLFVSHVQRFDHQVSIRLF